jgi:magnesium-transporting ATPase (P-type)
MILPLAYVMTEFEPSRRLDRKVPSSRILSVDSLLPLIGNLVISATFLGLSLLVGKTSKINVNEFNKISVEGTMIFFVASFQIVLSGILHTKGSPHREKKHRKKVFVVFVLSTLLFSVFMLLTTCPLRSLGVSKFIRDHYGFAEISGIEFASVLIIVIINAFVAIYFELHFSRYCVELAGKEEDVPLYQKMMGEFEEYP